MTSNNLFAQSNIPDTFFVDNTHAHTTQSTNTKTTPKKRNNTQDRITKHIAHTFLTINKTKTKINTQQIANKHKKNTYYAKKTTLYTQFFLRQTTRITHSSVHERNLPN